MVSGVVPRWIVKFFGTRNFYGKSQFKNQREKRSEFVFLMMTDYSITLRTGMTEAEPVAAVAEVIVIQDT